MCVVLLRNEILQQVNVLFSVFGFAFLARFQYLSVDSPGRASRWCGSGNKCDRHALPTWAGLGADLPDPVSPRKDQKQLYPSCQHGTWYAGKCCMWNNRRRIRHLRSHAVTFWKVCLLKKPFSLSACLWFLRPPSSFRVARWSCGGPTDTVTSPFTVSLSEAFRMCL